jgi:hypothetical protein
MPRCKRTWFALVWTVAAIGVGVLARFTFAAPAPPCPPSDDFCFEYHFEGVYYVLILLVWLLGLAVIWFVGWYVTRRQTRSAVWHRERDERP